MTPITLLSRRDLFSNRATTNRTPSFFQSSWIPHTRPLWVWCLLSKRNDGCNFTTAWRYWGYFGLVDTRAHQNLLFRGELKRLAWPKANLVRFASVFALGSRSFYIEEIQPHHTSSRTLLLWRINTRSLFSRTSVVWSTVENHWHGTSLRPMMWELLA